MTPLTKKANPLNATVLTEQHAQQAHLVQSLPRRGLLDSSELKKLEEAHHEGLTVSEIVSILATQGERLTEATFRKYVQLGLLPRSTRVGKKGKHRGSQGLYPPATLRRLLLIRSLMDQGFTIEQIRSQSTFVKIDIDTLREKIDEVLKRIENTVNAKAGDLSTAAATRTQLSEVKKMAADLIARLQEIDRRMTLQTRMSQAAI